MLSGGETGHLFSLVSFYLSLTTCHYACPGRVAQSAEAADLKSVQCGFDSRRGYSGGSWAGVIFSFREACSIGWGAGSNPEV